MRRLSAPWATLTTTFISATATVAATVLVLAPTAASGSAPDDRGDRAVDRATVTGPLASDPNGDPKAADPAATYPFFSTYEDLEGRGYVEEEFLLSGEADAYASPRTPSTEPGTLLAEDVPYTTRMVVRRPADAADFNGTVLVEWQNVTAGYDLDALWNYEDVTRNGYAWVGVSAQQVGVDQLREWSPARYGDLDVTGDGAYPLDQLSFDIYAQAGKALADPAGNDPMGGLEVDNLLSIGASQSTRYQSMYYDHLLPTQERVFDGYGNIVGWAPQRQGEEPVFQALSETDVASLIGAERRPDDDSFRRWEVAGAAHSGWQGQEYRAPLSERDLGGVTDYTCDLPPFSRVPMHHVTASVYAHLDRWARGGVAPPSAPYLELDDDGRLVRDELGIAQGGIRLSQVEEPTALDTGVNSGATFCFLFGSHRPFSEAQLAELHPTRGGYVAGVGAVDRANLRAGYLQRADARQNHRDAVAFARTLR